MMAKRAFVPTENNNGLMCPYNASLCRDECCKECQIYLDWQKLGEKVVMCGSCGKVMYKTPDFGRSVLFYGLCDECEEERVVK